MVIMQPSCSGAEIAAAAIDLMLPLLKDSASRTVNTLQGSGYRPEVRTVAVREGESGICSVVLKCESGCDGDGGGGWNVPLMEAGGGVIVVVGDAHGSLTATSDPIGPQDKYNDSAVGIVIAGMAAIAAGTYVVAPVDDGIEPTFSMLPGGGIAG